MGDCDASHSAGARETARGSGAPEAIHSSRAPEAIHSLRAPEAIHSSRAPEAVGAYPHAKRAGQFVFLSGVGPRQLGSKVIPGVDPFDFERQCRACFENVKLVVADAGLPWLSVVDVTVFLTNMKRDFAVYNRIYAECFAGEGNPNPARTTVEVLGLPTPIAVEVKAICVVPPSA